MALPTEFLHITLSEGNDRGITKAQPVPCSALFLHKLLSDVHKTQW